MNWNRPHKYHLIRHAEVNAIKHAKGDTKGATIYVTAPPCPACMLAIVDAEIDRVVYFPVPKKKEGSSMIKNQKLWKQTKEIAERGSVKLEQFSGNISWLKDHIVYLEELGIFGQDKDNAG